MTLREILIGKAPGRSLIRGLCVAALLLAGSRFLLVPVRAHGISMLPTVSGRPVHLREPAGLPVLTPKRGDVVAITLKGGEAVLVKRIIALPGETVRIDAGQVFINGFPLDEPYRHYFLAWEMKDGTVAADEVFVIGDNRSMRLENHDFGFARQDRILGRAIN